MLHRICLTTLTALLLSVLSVVTPTGSVALPPPVSVRADEVHLALDRTRTVTLDFPAQHAAVYWRGHPEAAVEVAFSSDGETYGRWRDAGRDEVGEQRGDGTTYGAVLTADDARWVRVRSDRPLARASVLGMKDAEAGSAQETAPPAATATADTSQPPVRSRAEWGADERLRSGSPSFARVRRLVVHHTATSNAYSSRAEAESQIRAILRYHTVTQGWSDIGYNFLIDKFGTIYEGRWSRVYAGTDPSGDNLAGDGVVGAHTASWNTGSTGVAMLGTHTDRDVTAAARASLERLLAWQAARNGIDPTAKRTFTNPNGLSITVPTIAGHRDYAATECPGGTFHRTFPALRSAVAARMSSTSTDTTAPTRPTGLTGSPRRHRVLLDWSPSTDDSGTAPRYRVLRSGSGTSGSWRLVGTTADSAHVDTGLRRDRRYYYKVRAVDAAGNVSPASAELGVRTLR